MFQNNFLTVKHYAGGNAVFYAKKRPDNYASLETILEFEFVLLDKKNVFRESNVFFVLCWDRVNGT